MARLQGGRFKTIEELGQSIIDQLPGLRGRDPEEIGEQAMQNPKYAQAFVLAPENFGDIDVSTALRKAPGDFADTAGETLEGLGEMLSHPIDTGEGLLKLGAAGARGAARMIPGAEQAPPHSMLGTLARMNLSPETEQGAREFKDEVVRSVGPEGIQNRPALALSNALMAVPGGAGVRAASIPGQVGKFNRALQFAKKARNIVDPAEIPFTAARGLGRGAKSVTGGARAFAQKIAEQGINSASDFAQSLQQGKGGLLGQALEASLGFTTGNGPRFVREMFRTGKGEGGTIQREFRSMDQAAAERIIVQRGLQAVDSVKKQMGEAYEAALGNMDLGAPIDIDLDMRRQAQSALEDLNVKVEGAEVPVTQQVPVEPTDLPSGSQFPESQQRFRAEETGEVAPSRKATLTFPEFGDEFDQTTSVAKQGTGQSLIRDAFKRLINAPEQVSVNDLMMFRRSIDDALNAASADVSGEARVALGKLRGIVAERLGGVEGYKQAMSDYEEASAALFNFDAELGLRPGNLRDGEIRNVKVSDVVGRMMGTLAKPTETAFGTLGELEKRGGDASLTPAMVGVGSSPLFGSGLVVKSEISQAMRILASFGTAGNVLTLPVSVAFSPRAVNEIFLRLVETDAPGRAGKAAQQGAGKARAAATTMAEALSKVDDAVRNQAIKEGWTLGQLFERLQISTGTEVEDGDFRPRDRLNLESIGKIDTGQPSPAR